MPTILRITRESGHASAFARGATADKPLCPPWVCYSSIGPARLRRRRCVSRHASPTSSAKRASLVARWIRMSVTTLSARLDEQATDLTLGIIREPLQPVGSNILLDDAVSPPLIGFGVRAQQSCEK